MIRLILTFLIFSSLAHAADPLRVFIRGGKKTHGVGQHEHEQFVKDWVPLLNARGATAEGGLAFPTKEQFDKTDVLVLHAEEAGNIAIGEERKNLLEFLKRGGGLVVIHGASVSRDPDWYKTIIGGSWRHGQTKWLEAPMNLYFTDVENPITKDCSNFEMNDEIYYDMDLLPEIKVLAGAYTPKPSGGRDPKKAEQLTGGGKKVSVYDIQPQMWTYEKDDYRAFVCIPGHLYQNFSRPNLRAMLLRGIAWAGKLKDTDSLCKPDELGDNLRYVEGGPTLPSKAAAKLEVHPEFNVSLVASEPLINKAMNLDWDEKGRMWVCETPEYPNGRRLAKDTSPTEVWKDSGSLEVGRYEREPEDRISILTDTDGDGIMDKKQVFADNLELVTSFCFYKKGVIACAAPDIWYLEDTDGDDVADKRTKLYTGLGIGDTHAVINNLRWGLDGWVYATHGYSAGNVTSGDGKTNFGRDGAGVVRFKPDGSMFEQYSSKNSNTWGLDMTWEGQCFFTQPTCGDVLMHVVLPESVLAKGKLPGTNSFNVLMKGEKTFPLMHWEEQAYVQIDQVGAFTAAAGCAIYEGGAWPAPWNYSYFTGEPTINIVSHRFVTPDGVTYKAEKEKGREQTEFIRSSDLWFRPIETRAGPDGALYVIDFYNQAVIHNDTRGPQHGPANAAVRPDRDHYFGRIWKVNHKQAEKIEVPMLDKTDLKGLINAVKWAKSAAVKKLAWRLIRENHDPAEIASTDQWRESSPLSPIIGVMLEMLAKDAGKSAKDFVSENSMAAPFLKRPGPNAEIEKTSPLTTGSQVLRKYQASVEAVSRGDESAISTTVGEFAAATDVWTRSAIIAALSEHSVPAIKAALVHPEPGAFVDLVRALFPNVLAEDKPGVTGTVDYGGGPSTITNQPIDAVLKLIQSCAAAEPKADALKVIILDGISQKVNFTPPLTPALTENLRKLITGPGTAGPALTIVTKWDKDRVLGAELDAQLSNLGEVVAGRFSPLRERIDAAKALVAVGGSARKLVIAALTTPGTPHELQKAIIGSLGESGDVSVLVDAYSGLPATVRSVAFDEILKRPEAAVSLLTFISEGKINAADIGPGNVARLRSHPDKQVARQAAAIMDKLSPLTVEKNAAIARLTPEVEKPGNVANGKMLFGAACAICHKLGDVGLRDVGPQLTGMGAHGPAELLVHIVDPNREVDPSFWQWNITTKKGETLVGVIASENAASLTLRSQTGDLEIKKDDIATRENTNRSLMPEGLDALGPEALRDILAFICAGDQKFRIVDLKNSYTADGRRGLFAKEEETRDSVFPIKYGTVTAEGIPFSLTDPARSATGTSLVVLKGGRGNNVAQSYPQQVDIPLHVTAKRLHLLSGIAGWGWPSIKDAIPAMKVTVLHEDGQSEVTELINGSHFADYNRVIEVPGSKLVEGVVSKGQLRLISLEVKKPGPISKVTLESYNNGVTPVVVSMTADIPGTSGQPAGGTGVPPVKTGDTGVPPVQPQAPAASTDPTPKEGAKGDGPLQPAAPISWEPGKTKVLLVGGGSSHNFAKFFGESDTATLKAAGYAVHYTEDRDQAAAELANADVAVISVNRQFFDTPAWRKAVFDFAAAGKGIIMLHPGTWFGYSRWSELNARIVGGGSRGHDKLGPFEVNVLTNKKDHPVMAGVPANFAVEDELYYMNAEPHTNPPDTSPIEVLAETSPSQKYGRPHPSVWITQHEKARIVGIALGHDARVHELPAFKTLLSNAVKWAGGR